MRIDDSELSTIRIRTEYDDAGKPVDYQFEWKGDSNIVGITFELLEEGDPELLGFCQRAEIFPGDVAMIGPYEMKMIGVNYDKSLIYCERI
jgi:hypothetical protein